MHQLLFLKKTMTIIAGTTIQPGEFLTYSYQSVWFTDSHESVELRDENGIIIDKTPLLSDIANDFTSWQRVFDGYDLDGTGDWKFVTSTIGSSNGKLVETLESETISVTVTSEKSSYLFGDVAVISGSISKEVNPVQPEFLPELIKVHILGPNFVDKTVSLYPDLNLNYETTLSLRQVLGIHEGNYDVSVSYGGATTNTSFTVGFELIELAEKIDSSFNITTDKSQYLPGQTVSVSGFATEIIPFQGMKFTITDSEGISISNGNLFPTDGEFSTSLFLTTVNPNYGIYEIVAEYFDKSASITFEVLEDIKEDVSISLWTDKITYGLGEEVTITGRLNQVWVGYLDLEIEQTKQSESRTGSSDIGFKILDGVRMLGDGTFSYKFTIPDNSNRLGDYRIHVSKDVGSATMFIHAAINPDEFIISDEPLTITSDKDLYELGETVIVTGSIKDLYENLNYGSSYSVSISISNEDGSPLEITGLPKKGKQLSKNGVIVAYEFTAIPTPSGDYSIQFDVTPGLFAAGNYIIKSDYFDEVTTTSISVIEPFTLKEGSILTLDKEVYGLGETVHLTGIVAPSGDNSVAITLTKPDGTKYDLGTLVEDQHFSWSWTTPISESYQNIKIDDGRDVTKSNFGIYKIKVEMSSGSKNIFFKVSSDPENDSISTIPIYVSAEKSLYRAGEKLKVMGNVFLRDQGSEGLVVPERVLIKIVDGSFPFKEIHRALVYPTQGGEFFSLFELPVTIFSEGNYTIRVIYDGKYAENTFGVANDFIFGIDDPVSLLVSTDKTEYYPGDVVIITGKPNKLIYLEAFDVSVIQKSDADITCGTFVCGTKGPMTSISPSPSGSFAHEFTIPNSASAIGLYEVTVNAEFETKYVQFNVVEYTSTPKSNTIVEKENRISDKILSILTEEKTFDSSFIAPRVLSGSLITPVRGEESAVNLKVSSESGICIIGPDVDCLVSESTRKPGQIYDVVEVDGMNLNVRYSGPDVRLEKFSILPESSTDFLPNTNWNVEVIKDDQVSRFYYKVTFKTLE